MTPDFIVVVQLQKPCATHSHRRTTVSATGREFTCAPFFGEKAADAHEKVVEGTKGLVRKGRQRARDRFSVETGNLGSMTADTIEGIFHI